MKLTLADSGLLIAAARGTDEVHRRAIELLDDPDREFVGSTFLRLEVIPKPYYNGFPDEAEFYEEFFSSCVRWVEGSEDLALEALAEGKRHGLGAMDSLHVVSARRSGAVELLTTEATSTPLHRVTTPSVITIHSR
jgi:hypothetical protein